MDRSTFHKFRTISSDIWSLPMLNVTSVHARANTYVLSPPRSFSFDTPILLEF